jgi:hypothetical protein
MDFVVAYQMAIRGFAIPAVLAFRMMLFASYLRIHCSPSKALCGTTSRLMPIPKAGRTDRNIFGHFYLPAAAAMKMHE